MSTEPLRIWWNKNLHGKISPGKLAAHAAHAALRAYGIEYDHPIVVLAAGRGRIESMPITVRDEGRTELEPGTLTAGVERSWQASRPVTDAEVEAAARALNVEGWTCNGGEDEPGNYDSCPDCKRVCDPLARVALEAARTTRGADNADR
ncbi:hypothetical protein [Agromyces larvae]|uniref:Aminoacyl-tRNA hydrolase n=1 Tax=Agromyces larvae TaxID=2929802 RepID=A0ABY4C371_9MICO|nr:hypothetical protein [Agromyces larvae]UOE45921.1 hypothetical protein MTO99_09330 [Agromyces larvae]